MEKYSLQKEIGKGSFGTVFRSVNKSTLEVYAIKKVIYLFCYKEYVYICEKPCNYFYDFIVIVSFWAMVNN